MIESGKLSMLDIEELCRIAYKNQCEFTVSVTKDSVEVGIEPSYPTEIESHYTTREVPRKDAVVIKTDGLVDDVKVMSEELREQLREKGWNV